MKQRGSISLLLAILLAIAVALTVYLYHLLNVSGGLLDEATRTASLEAEQLNDDVRRLRAQRDALNEQLHASETRRAAAEAEAAEMRERLDEVVDGRHELTARLSEVEVWNQQLLEELEDMDKQLADAEAELLETRASLQNMTTERNEAHAQLSALQARLDEATDERDRNIQIYEDILAASVARADAAEEIIEALDRELAAATADRERLSQRAAEAEADNREHGQRLVDLEATLATTREELAAARAELAARDARLSELAEERLSVEERYRRTREQLALQQARNEDYSQTIADLEGRLSMETAAMDQLQRQLQSLSNERESLVSRLEDGTTVIKLPENILFASGSARISDAGQETLRFLADALESFTEHLISVQGHSDGQLISPSLQTRYPSNWELSSARASAAVQVLIAAGINPDRLQAVGYADSRPLVEETDADSRRANRRIEVLLYPKQFNTRVLADTELQ